MGEKKLSTRLLWYSRRAMYGSLLLSFDFDRILLHVCTDFLTSPFALGYIGLEFNPPSLSKFLKSIKFKITAVVVNHDKELGFFPFE